jgi:hypothetical protein
VTKSGAEPSKQEIKMSGKLERLNRERRTIKSMIGIYCRGNKHSSEILCKECHALLSYALQRIDKCPFRTKKPVCAKCSVHCYKADMREEIRKIMRYSGPRMMIYHPIFAIRHYMHQITGK